MTAWQQIRQQVLERDGFQCQHCGSINRLEIHHITPRRKGGLDILQNILTLCRKCHKTIEPCRKMGYPNKVTSGISIAVSNETHAKILDCGKMGETLDAVVTRIVNYYRENALGKK